MIISQLVAKSISELRHSDLRVRVIIILWIIIILHCQFSSVQSLSCVQLFATLCIAARQASLSITNSRSSLRLTSIKSVMPSSHLILGRPLLPLSPIPPSIKVFSNESTLRMRWPKYWSFSFVILLFTASDLASITSHIHSWVLFLLWLYPFILSGVISPVTSSSILGTYWPGEYLFQYPIILPFHTVHGVLKARILIQIPLVQGKEQQLCFAGAAVKRYSAPKVRETQVRW